MTTQTDAKKLAEETLASSWKPGVFPVDPIAIANDLGVVVYSASIGDDVSGMLRKAPDGVPEIFLDAYEPPVRRRFSCAHELGHFVRHAEREELAFVDYRGPGARNGNDPEEVFANQFAANLLMPEAEVKAQFKNNGPLKLADYFDVSLDAITFRLKNLRLIA